MKNKNDFWSLLALILFPLLIAYQWKNDNFYPVLYGITCTMPLAITVINHNIGHVPMWNNAVVNQITEYYGGTLQGVPLFLFQTVHIDSHHQYNQGEKDATRLSRVGHHNHLIGYVMYPFFSLAPVRKLRENHLRSLTWKDLEMKKVVLQHLLLVGMWGGLLILDWQKTLVYVIIPQMIGVHFLMGSNYLQHAKCEVGSSYNHSRNFVGKVFNALFFNVGFHTAHHHDPTLHWSKLPVLHKEIQKNIDVTLCKKSFIGYFFYDLTLAPVLQYFGSTKNTSKN